MWPFRSKNVARTRLVVLDDQTWQERSIVAADEEQVSDGQRSFPKSSILRYWDEAGQEVWLANPPRQTLIDAQELEDLRKKHVLRNVFAYQKPLPNINYVIYVGLLLVILVMVWRR